MTTSRLQAEWRGPGGIREVLILAYPLILSQLSFTIQTFVDRLFLTWYSPAAVAGAVTGLFLTWTMIGLCVGTGEYVTTFVAQYLGAGRPRRVGPAVWQGLYFALAAGAVIAGVAPFADDLFAQAGHPPDVYRAETDYARTLMLGSFPAVLMPTLASFFAGRGQTGVVLAVNIGTTAVNVVLDWLWIFGRGGFPEGGVTGAALATVVSQAFGASCYLVLMLQRRHRDEYDTLGGWRLDRPLFGRLIRYGLPAGLHYSAEILGFAVFMIVVGRIGTADLAATSIAFNLNMIVFMPMLGCGLAVTALVGRYLGSDQPEVAERATWSAFKACFVYMAACGALYVLAPGLLLAPYAAGTDDPTFPAVAATAGVLLRFVAFYSIFDTMNVIFASGLKGAGDTVYPVAASTLLSWVVMVIPAWFLCVRGGEGIYVAWTTAALYVFCVGILMFVRFRRGEWKTMRVIEQHDPAAIAAAVLAEGGVREA